QIDDSGNLTFFKSEQLEKGILLDYDSMEMSERQTLRLYFVVDGTKLPTGDVFGVIFAETVPLGQTGAQTSVRVGSLVMLTNQTPGSRTAEITKSRINFLQVGESFGGEVTVKNPASPGETTGFFPEMKVEVTPIGGSSSFEGPLIFAGRSRT